MSRVECSSLGGIEAQWHRLEEILKAYIFSLFIYVIYYDTNIEPDPNPDPDIEILSPILFVPLSPLIPIPTPPRS